MEEAIKNIKKGMNVEIMTRQGKVAKGLIDDVGTRISSLYGPVVRLSSGEIGNVKKILSPIEENGKKDSVEILKMIEKGESFFVEFKTNCLWSANFNEDDIKQSKSFDVHTFKQKASKVIIAKSIASFLNSGGGSLVIGIKEKKSEGDNPKPDKKNEGLFEIVGIEDEFTKLKDQSKDGYKRMIIDDILRSFFPPKIYNHLNEYIWINFVELKVGDSKKTVCWVKIKKCDVKVFLKVNDKEMFMIRTDTENRLIDGEKMVDYCMKRFSHS